MDKRISIFIFSCFLTWTGSDPNATVALPKESSPSLGESGSTKIPTITPGTSLPTTVSSPSPTNASKAETHSHPGPDSVPSNSTDSPESGSSSSYTTDSPESGSSSSNNMESTNITSSPAPTTPTFSVEYQTNTLTTQELSASSNKITTLSKDSSTRSHTPSPKLLTTVSSGSSKKHIEWDKSKATSEKRYLWILLPGLCGLLASIIYLKFKCKKVQHQSQMTDNGTENASFQRTDSNKDGVMLLGVSKTPSGEEM